MSKETADYLVSYTQSDADCSAWLTDYYLILYTSLVVRHVAEIFSVTWSHRIDVNHIYLHRRACSADNLLQ